LNPSIVQKKKNVPQEYLLPFLPWVICYGSFKTLLHIDHLYWMQLFLYKLFIHIYILSNWYLLLEFYASIELSS
jgi:hypothetical protein